MAVCLIWRAIRSRVFVIFLAVDGVFVLIHLLLAIGPWASHDAALDYLRINKDHSVSEFFEYAMTAAGIAAAIVMIRRTRDPAYWTIAAILLYLLLDNSLRIHENVGRLFPEQYHHSQALFTLLSGVLFALLGLACLRRSTRKAITVLTAVGLAVVFTAFFGVGVDWLHGTFMGRDSRLNGAVALIEDGGELLGLTIIGALMLAVVGWPRRVFGTEEEGPDASGPKRAHSTQNRH